MDSTTHALTSRLALRLPRDKPDNKQPFQGHPAPREQRKARRTETPPLLQSPIKARRVRSSDHSQDSLRPAGRLRKVSNQHNGNHLFFRSFCLIFLYFSEIRVWTFLSAAALPWTQHCSATPLITFRFSPQNRTARQEPPLLDYLSSTSREQPKNFAGPFCPAQPWSCINLERPFFHLASQHPGRRHPSSRSTRRHPTPPTTPR